MNVECWATQPKASPNSPRICSARQNLGSRLDHRVRRRPTPAPPGGSRENRGSHFTNWTEKQQHKHSRGRRRTWSITLFCLRALFSFMWGQSFPVTTDLISETGTGGEKLNSHTSESRFRRGRLFWSILLLSLSSSKGTSPWGDSSRSP